MLDSVLPGSVLRWWKDVFPQATVHEIEDASHFLQEDAPLRIGCYISEFMSANP
jgi:pimeloyl-ACP methyl ester carboxylesterase